MYTQLYKYIEQLVDRQVARDPKLLETERGKAAITIESVLRSEAENQYRRQLFKIPTQPASQTNQKKLAYDSQSSSRSSSRRSSIVDDNRGGDLLQQQLIKQEEEEDDFDDEDDENSSASWKAYRGVPLVSKASVEDTTQTTTTTTTTSPAVPEMIFSKIDSYITENTVGNEEMIKRIREMVSGNK